MCLRRDASSAAATALWRSSSSGAAMTGSARARPAEHRMSSSAHSAGNLRPELVERVLRDFEGALAQLPESVVSRSARRRSAEQLRQLGWPSVRDEQWRYARVRAFDQVS